MLSDLYKDLPEYSSTMYLQGYTPEQIMAARRRSIERDYRRRQETATTERAAQAQIEKQLKNAVSKALDDLFKGWK